MKEEAFFSGRERLFKQLFCMIDWWRYVGSKSLATAMAVAMKIRNRALIKRICSLYFIESE